LLCLGNAEGGGDEQMLHEAHDAVYDAIEHGRVDRALIARRAAEVRSRGGSLRVRRQSIPAPPLAAALDRLEQLGAETADRAVELRRASLSGGPVVVVDARMRPDIAAGARRCQLAEILREYAVESRELDYPSDLEDRGADVLVLTRLPRSDPKERDRLAEILRARPDAIVVHAGVPDAAPDHGRLVLALGAGRSMQRAAVGALLAAGREDRRR
ncbi:MAG: beta-glucosidase, partial [Brachybacterium sp.]|nr:beta-glucosidase [Brachybacterium sp.]